MNRKFKTLGLVILLIAGCKSPVTGSFNTVSAKASPDRLVGYWSGKLGPFKSSFKLQADGNGLFCYSRGKLNKVEKVKYHNGVIYTQRKTSVIIEKLSDRVMTVEVNNFGSVNYTFEKDEKLQKTSRYCQGRLRW